MVVMLTYAAARRTDDFAEVRGIVWAKLVAREQVVGHLSQCVCVCVLQRAVCECHGWSDRQS